jgi:CHAD domain-containing protein
MRTDSVAVREAAAAAHGRAVLATGTGAGAGAGLQFEVDDVARVRQLLRAHRGGPALEIGVESTTTLLDTYFDTADWRLRRAGGALRLRRVNGTVEATLELHSGARLIDQRLPAASVRPPDVLVGDLARRCTGPVGTRVHAVVGRRRLVPLFEVTTTRHAYPIRIDGAPVGALVIDDSASARGRRRRAVRLTRLHLAGDDRAGEALALVVALLAGDPPLIHAAPPTFETLLAAHALEPAESASRSPGITATMTVGEVALAAIGRQLGRLLALEPATRLGEDREALHDMRVAIRRLRATLRLFRPVLSVRAQRVHEDLRIVAAGLGRVRDLDVQLEELEGYRRADGAADARALRPLVALYSRRRVAARQHMLRVLDSRHYHRAVVACLAMLRHGPLRSVAAARAPILGAAPTLIERSYRRFRRLGDRIAPTSPPEQCHALRIRCKRLRYAVEVHAGIYGKPARAWLRRLVELQQVLGAHQDAVVGAAQLRELGQGAERAVPARSLAAVSRLAAWNDERARVARRAFPRAYRKILGKRLHRLWRTLDERAEEATTTASAG